MHIKRILWQHLEHALEQPFSLRVYCIIKKNLLTTRRFINEHHCLWHASRQSVPAQRSTFLQALVSNADPQWQNVLCENGRAESALSDTLRLHFFCRCYSPTTSQGGSCNASSFLPMIPSFQKPLFVPIHFNGGTTYIQVCIRNTEPSVAKLYQQS